MSYVLDNPPDLHLLTVNRAGAVISEQPNAMIDHVTWELCQPGECIYSVPVMDPRAKLIRPYITESQVWYGGVPIWIGPNWQRQANSKATQWKAEGLYSYLKKRFVMTASLLYTTLEQTLIASNLISAAQSGTNMSYGINNAGMPISGHNRSRNYDRNRHQCFFDMLAEFPTLRDGFEFDFIVDVTGTNKTFNAYYPTKGVNNPITTFEWDADTLQGQRNLSDFAFTEDGYQLETLVYATGGSNGGVKFENNYEDTTASGAYGVAQGIVADSTQQDVNWLYDLAYRNVQTYKAPLVTPTLTAIEAPDTLLGVISTGDTILIKINCGDVQVNGQFRIQKIVWSPSKKTLEITPKPPIVLA